MNILNVQHASLECLDLSCLCSSRSQPFSYGELYAIHRNFPQLLCLRCHYRPPVSGDDTKPPEGLSLHPPNRVYASVCKGFVCFSL